MAEEWSGEEIEELQEALLSAFPTEDKLRRMVRTKLDENLAAIAGGEDLSDKVFNLISWGEARGRLGELTLGARQANPGNNRLLAFARKKYGDAFQHLLTASETSANSAISPVDDCMVLVPGGEFLMGEECTPTSVNSFWIDEYPVTNYEYAVFVNETGHEPPSHWIGKTVPRSLENHPVVNVNWYDALSYAEWRGKRLPTSAQWEKAARGTDGRVFPWGDEFDKSKCNTKEGGLGKTTPVGKYPAGASIFGVYDLSGNVWEWTRTEDRPGSFAIRGGAWKVVSVHARCFSFRAKARVFANDDLGFRCVR